MSVFQGKLYCGFSSGLQGSVLKSTGCEIWRYDGAVWEPVISDKRDTEEEGAITMISGCSNNDGALTAQFTDNTKTWMENAWAGAVEPAERELLALRAVHKELVLAHFAFKHRPVVVSAGRERETPGRAGNRRLLLGRIRR